MDRRPAYPAGTFWLPVGPGHREVQAHDLLYPAAEPALVPLHRREAAAVDGAEVKVGLTGGDPLGQRVVPPPRERDARGVEPGTHAGVIELARQAHDEVVVGGEAFPAVVDI